MRKQFGVGRRGFTLLELVVASALGSIMVVAVAVLLGRGLITWQQADSRLQQLFRIEKGLDMLGQELRNGVVLADRPFEGSAGRISFAMAEGPTRLSWLRYRLGSVGEEQALVRESEPILAEEAVPVTKTLVPRVKSFSIRYAALKEEGGQKVVQWVQEWGTSSQPVKSLPKLLEIRIESEDSRGKRYSVVREFRIPQGTWGAPSVE